jgi:hypothetical protein
MPWTRVEKKVIASEEKTRESHQKEREHTEENYGKKSKTT